MTTSTVLKLDNVTNITSAMVNKLVALRAEKAVIDKEAKELDNLHQQKALYEHRHQIEFIDLGAFVSHVVANHLRGISYE